jgi:2-succinyl-5-enolpyruvyl-6-hydroxy-3-cyclohexene-1-carboxylate synthase
VAAAPDLVVVDRFHLEPDTESRASLRLKLDPGELSFGDRHLIQSSSEGADVVTTLTDGGTPPDTGSLFRGGYRPGPTEWSEVWRSADRLARTAMDGFIDGLDEPFEPRVARDFAAWIPDGGTLFVGNSSPVRDLDLAMTPRDGLRVLANRGASGIDGLISTALGIERTGRGPTFALLGDLSFLHDVGALMWNAHRVIQLTLVVLNNGGGELFAQLPQRALAEHEQLFLTTHGLDLGAICAAARIDHVRVERSSELIPSLERPRGSGIAVVEVVVDVQRQRKRRAELSSAIDAALA